MNKFFVPVAIVLTGWLTQAASAGGHLHGGCAADSCCESDCGCGKTCRLEMTTKEIKVICWGCECEDFCVPGPSCEGCRHVDEGACNCGEGSCECDHKPDCRFIYKDWTPGECAEVRTKKNLVKYEMTKKIPSFKWVVEDACKAAKPAAPAPAAKGAAASDLPFAPNAPVSYQRPVNAPRDNAAVWSFFNK